VASGQLSRESSQPLGQRAAVENARPAADSAVSVRKAAVRVDVSATAPAGCNELSVDLFAPQDVGADALLWVCVPGGGISRRYFDLDVNGLGGFSMAGFLSRGGDFVVTIDPPGVGESDRPDDGYLLTPHLVADVLAAAVESLEGDPTFGGLVDAQRGQFAPRVKIGLGHSAGALLIACQQARHRSFDALALLGFSASGLPAVLNEEELGYAGRPKELAGAVAKLSEARFGDPLPQWSNSVVGELEPGTIAAAIDTALAQASSKLLALVGMTAIVPGSVQPELDQLRAPIFAALGERDLAGKLDVLPGQLPACGDLTLFLLEGAGHNHNVAPNRQILWRRLARWAASIEPPRRESGVE
jgi:pimeloyl-ACP methyl ester carboxylesterase